MGADESIVQIEKDLSNPVLRKAQLGEKSKYE